MNIILGIVFFAAIACLVYFFIVEGFQATSGPISRDAICAANKTCSTCLATANCGWAGDYSAPVSGLQGVADGSVIACIPMSGGQPFITPNLANLMIKKNGTMTILKKFVNNVADCTDITCSAQTTCASCPKYKKCLWQQVMAADGTVTQSCMDLSGAPAADTTRNNITELSKCPQPQCSELTDCQDCTNTTGCSYCVTSRKCIKTSQVGSGPGSGPGSGSGSNQCPTASLISMPSSCPCGGITDCGKCSERVGCGFCKGIKQCVNLNRYGAPPANTCSADDIATSSSQCSPGTMLSRTSESGPKPTAANLSAAQDSGIVDRAAGFDLSATQNLGDGAVSPMQSYKIVSAPGVARPAGASSIPATVRKDTGLYDAPLESYVKMLVNSQLAAQGVPTNEPFQSGAYQGQGGVAAEPFQVSQEQAIPNATDYMKKVFRGVFS
jgi:hypothetical protein